MKSCSKLQLSFLLCLLLFIIPAPLLRASVLMKEFTYVNQPVNWTVAQQICREHHVDLATVRTIEEEEQLATAVDHIGKSSVWIGLQRDATEYLVWRWMEGGGSSSEDVSKSQNWATSPPRARMCACVRNDTKRWYTISCSTALPSYCSNGNKVRLVTQAKTWSQANMHCRDSNEVLATITSSANLTVKVEHDTWIGLFKDDDNIWRWAGKEKSQYRNWDKGEPLDRNCGYVTTVNKKWQSGRCSNRLPFFCYRDNLVLVRENKTWEEALEHCRAIDVDSSAPHLYRDHLYDLVSLQSGADHCYARGKIQNATTNQVWTGLRFLAGQWLWVNREQMEYKDLPVCPAQWKHCGTLPKDDRSHWEVRDCMETRNFLCYKRGITIIITDKTTTTPRIT